MTYHARSKHKRMGRAILILDKVELKTMSIT